MRGCTGSSQLVWVLRRRQADPFAGLSRCPGPASATMSHHTPLGSSVPQANCLDLWRAENDRLVRQAKVTWFLGPWLFSPKIPERVCCGFTPANGGGEAELDRPLKPEITGEGHHFHCCRRGKDLFSVTLHLTFDRWLRTRVCL